MRSAARSSSLCRRPEPGPLTHIQLSPVPGSNDIDSRGLRGHTTGLAVPHLAVDLPGGGGKVTLQPDYVVEKGPGQTVLRNYRGERYLYPEPEETDCSCPYDEVWVARPR